MFLLDNQVVREDWKKAKSLVTDTLRKHGAKVVSARRWDERRLAYPIRRRRRATYCLTFYEMGNAGILGLRRDLELNENILRYMILAKDTVPASEIELAAAEDAAGFAVPAPPPDDAPDAPVARRREDGTEGEAEPVENPQAEGDEAGPARTPEKEA
jgi:small subunit ribosomal protein S6